MFDFDVQQKIFVGRGSKSNQSKQDFIKKLSLLLIFACLLIFAIFALCSKNYLRCFVDLLFSYDTQHFFDLVHLYLRNFCCAAWSFCNIYFIGLIYYKRFIGEKLSIGHVKGNVSS